MIVEECNIECIDTVKCVVEKAMGWFHAYYATSCLESGLCRAVVAVNRDVVGVGVYYKVELKPLSLGVIYYVVVSNEYRGRGIGKAIVASIEELMDSNDLGFYIASVREDNIESRRMLTGMGYTEIFLDSLDDVLREAFLQIVCAYDDDIVAVKSVRGDLEKLFEILKDRRNSAVIREVWRVQCYIPWRKLRKV